MTPGVEFSLGIDLAQDSFEVALAREGVAAGAWRELPNTHVAHPPDSAQGIKRLLAWAREQCPEGRCARVVVEATGQLSKRFARALRGHGLPEPAIINPRRSKALGDSLGVREKTDRIDCAVLAVYAWVQEPEPAPPVSPAQEKLRELTRARRSYLSDLGRWENRLREADEPETKQFLRATIRHLRKQIERLDQAIERAIAQDARLARQVENLKKIKCIKQVAASTLTAELGDLTAYGRGQIVGRVGLFARKFESGSSVRRRPRLVKGGGARVRSVLYMCATSALSSKGALRRYAERLRARGLEEMEILMALMRKLLLICRAVAVQDGAYDESRILAQETTP